MFVSRGLRDHVFFTALIFLTFILGALSYEFIKLHRVHISHRPRTEHDTKIFTWQIIQGINTSGTSKYTVYLWIKNVTSWQFYQGLYKKCRAILQRVFLSLAWTDMFF
jgi:hypothetical protein